MDKIPNNTRKKEMRSVRVSLMVSIHPAVFYDVVSVNFWHIEQIVIAKLWFARSAGNFENSTMQAFTSFLRPPSST
jgi:hypothetical protein